MSCKNHIIFTLLHLTLLFQVSCDQLAIDLGEVINQGIHQNEDSHFKPYVDQNGWIRVLSKVNQELKLQFGGALTVQDLDFQLNIKDFGVSNSEQTMNTSQSWYFQDVKMRASIVKNIGGYPPQFINSEIINLKQVIINVLNGKTPTGSVWSQDYNEGYLRFSGKIKTYGDWNQFYQGCDWKSMITIGEEAQISSGGIPFHTGQFIHTNCNGYQTKDHSITSRWDWKDVRVFWIRT